MHFSQPDLALNRFYIIQYLLKSCLFPFTELNDLSVSAKSQNLSSSLLRQPFFLTGCCSFSLSSYVVFMLPFIYFVNYNTCDPPNTLRRDAHIPDIPVSHSNPSKGLSSTCNTTLFLSVLHIKPLPELLPTTDSHAPCCGYCSAYPPSSGSSQPDSLFSDVPACALALNQVLDLSSLSAATRSATGCQTPVSNPRRSHRVLDRIMQKCRCQYLLIVRQHRRNQRRFQRMNDIRNSGSLPVCALCAVLRILPLCQSWLFLCLYCLYCFKRLLLFQMYIHLVVWNFDARLVKLTA